MLGIEKKLQSIFKDIECIEINFFKLRALNIIETNIKNKCKNLVKKKLKNILILIILIIKKMSILNLII